MKHHLTYFLSHEGKRPLEDIYEVGQHVRMLHFAVLLQEKLFLAYTQTGSLIVIEVTVVRRGENCDDPWKMVLSRPVEQPITILLCLVAPYNTSYLILPQEVFSELSAEDVGTSTFYIVDLQSFQTSIWL